MHVFPEIHISAVSLRTLAKNQAKIIILCNQCIGCIGVHIATQSDDVSCAEGNVTNT